MEKNLELRGKKEMESKSELTQRRPVFIPAVDIFENKEALVLIADMPGVTNDGVEIHLEDSELTIRGKVLEEQQNVLPVYTEYRSGDYCQTGLICNLAEKRLKTFKQKSWLSVSRTETLRKSIKHY